MIYDAAIDELTQTIDLESKQKADEAVYCNLLATTQAEIIDNLFEDLEEIDPDNGDTFTNWLGTLGTTGTSVQTANTTEQSARSGRNSTNTTTLNNLKTVLAAERSTAEAAADRLYRNTEQNSWNDYLTSVQSANTVYLSNIKTAENTYKTAADAAESAYRTTSVTAYISFQETVKTLDTAFYAAVADADDVDFNTTVYFTTTGTNPNLPFQKTTFTAKMVDSTESSISTIGKTDEQIRGAARRAFGKTLIPAGWQVHHTYPVRLVQKFEKFGIDINASENLRAVHPSVHSYITVMQNEWFNGKIKAEIDALKKLKKYRRSSAKKILEQATRNVYTKITLDKINTFNNAVEKSFGDYLAKAKPRFFDNKISTIVKRTTMFLEKPDKVTKLANEARSRLGLKVLAGTAVIFAFIDSLAMASEIYNPSADTQWKFTTMMNRYAGCIDTMQHRKYIKQNKWFLLEDATLDYLKAINTDAKILNSLWYLFELEGSQLPN